MFSLFVPQRVDGVEAGGGHGRVHAEEDADHDRQAEADGDGPAADDGLPIGELADDVRPADAEQHADQSAGGREHDGFDEELQGDVPPLGPQRAADADLAGALGDRGQHDVHDADAAHQQRDAGDETRA